MTKCCSVYEMPFGYIIHPESRTVDGIWVFHGPVERLSNEVGVSALGSSVFNALSVSCVDIPNPEDWKAFNNEAKTLLNEQGVSSFMAIHKSGRLVSAKSDGEHICLTPTKNGGTSGDDRGYHDLSEIAISVSCFCTAAELGRAIKCALTLCE